MEWRVNYVKKATDYLAAGGGGGGGSREPDYCPSFRVRQLFRTELQSQKAVFAYITSEQILPFGFAVKDNSVGLNNSHQNSHELVLDY